MNYMYNEEDAKYLAGLMSTQADRNSVQIVKGRNKTKPKAILTYSDMLKIILDF